MPASQPYGRYDQGFFNTACELVDEISSRNYLHFLCELNAEGMDALRADAKRAGRTPPTYTAFVIKAAAVALRRHPHLNCMLQERPFSCRLVPLAHVTATVAVERMVNGVDMVFAPAVECPDERSLDDLTAQLQHFAAAPITEVPAYMQFCRLVRMARWLPWLTGRLFRIPSLSPKLWKRYRGGAFAVTSPGKYGGCDQVLPPWPWPLTFSFGAIKRRPWVVGDTVRPCQTMRLTITADRRLANGAPLARFAEDIRELLEHPEQLVDTLREAQVRTCRPQVEPCLCT